MEFDDLMREVDSLHPPGTIVVPVGALARYWQLYASLDALKVPKGTAMVTVEGVNVATNINKAIREKFTGEWLWVMGDDHSFRDDILLGLLDREVEIVVPVVSRRGVPFQTVFYKHAALDGSTFMTYSWDELSRDYPNGGLAVVDAAGSAGMLIRRHVLGEVGDPWFAWIGEKISEDVNFCLKARGKGFNVTADLDRTMTHITPCELEPYRDRDGKWQVAVSVDGRRVSLTNTPYRGDDMRLARYSNRPSLQAVA